MSEENKPYDEDELADKGCIGPSFMIVTFCAILFLFAYYVEKGCS